MILYQLKTAKEYLKNLNISDKIVNQEDLSEFHQTISELMQLYAEDVSKRFGAECANQALGNKMEISNALHERIDKMYKSIDWSWQS